MRVLLLSILNLNVCTLTLTFPRKYLIKLPIVVFSLLLKLLFSFEFKEGLFLGNEGICDLFTE